MCSFEAQIHKILAGLLDQYLLLNNKLALRVAQQLGDFFVERIDGIIITKGDAHWQVKLQDYQFRELKINTYWGLQISSRF